MSRQGVLEEQEFVNTLGIHNLEFVNSQVDTDYHLNCNVK